MKPERPGQWMVLTLRNPTVFRSTQEEAEDYAMKVVANDATEEAVVYRAHVKFLAAPMEKRLTAVERVELAPRKEAP